jgi:hypothetical protein
MYLVEYEPTMKCYMISDLRKTKPGEMSPEFAVKTEEIDALIMLYLELKKRRI